MLADKDCPKCGTPMWLGGKRVEGEMVSFSVCAVCLYRDDRESITLPAEEQVWGNRSKVE